VRRVEIDFRVDSLDERLRSSGFAVGAPTYVVWEGVTPYLSREAVDSTLSTVADVCGAGSRIALDLWGGVGGHAPGDEIRRAATRAFALIGEPLTFACRPERAPDLLGMHGFDVIDLVESDELAARYSTDGRPTEESTYVVAAEL
jgi:methyltransferase (TIGR00027 family)